MIKKKFIFLRHRIQCPSKVSSNQNLIQGIQGFDKSLPWLVNRNLLLKIGKCRNLFLYFYRKIVIKNNCVGNVRPKGHMRPAKHLYVARKHIFQVDLILKMTLKMLPFRKWTTESLFSLKSQFKQVHMVLILAPIDNFVSNVTRER